VTLWDGCTVRVAAINPTTGNIVSGVNISNVTFDIDRVDDGSGVDLTSGSFHPILIPSSSA